MDSHKSVCSTAHGAQVLRRIRPLLTLRVRKADHYISHTGIKMRSGQYVAPREHANRGEGYQELKSPVC